MVLGVATGADGRVYLNEACAAERSFVVAPGAGDAAELWQKVGGIRLPPPPTIAAEFGGLDLALPICAEDTARIAGCRALYERPRMTGRRISNLVW